MILAAAARGRSRAESSVARGRIRVQGGEWSMAQYLYPSTRRPRYVASRVSLPNFTAARPVRPARRPVRKPEIWRRRIGMYATRRAARSGTAFLRFVGLDPPRSSGGSGDIDTPWSAPMDQTCRAGVHAPAQADRCRTCCSPASWRPSKPPRRPIIRHGRGGPPLPGFSAPSSKSTSAPPGAFPRSI